jgi:hypothetical protein
MLTSKSCRDVKYGPLVRDQEANDTLQLQEKL